MVKFNLKFTVADTDRMIQLARSNWTAQQIAAYFTSGGKPTTAEEVRRICEETYTRVR